MSDNLTLVNEAILRAGATRRRAAAVARAVLQYWSIGLLVGAWQAWVVIEDVPRIVMPSPLAVLGDIVGNPGLYVSSALSTLGVTLAGLAGGMSLGILFAVLSWWSPLMQGATSPVAFFVRSVPIAAIIPIVASILGFNLKSVIAITILMSFFPTFVFAASGLRDLPARSDDLFKVYGSRRTQILSLLALPSAIPSILVALQLSVASCVQSALIAQYLLGSSGLGYLFATSINGAEFLTERAWGAAFVATFMAIVGFKIANRLREKGTDRWR